MSLCVSLSVAGSRVGSSKNVSFVRMRHRLHSYHALGLGTALSGTCHGSISIYAYVF